MPTPLDLARRAAPRPASAAVMPADEPFRDCYERAIRRSGLPANQRLVALILATYADRPTGNIPRDDQPGIKRLARATGLPALTVRDALRALTQVGWIQRASGSPAYEPGHVPDAAPVTLTLPPYARVRLGLSPYSGSPTS